MEIVSVSQEDMMKFYQEIEERRKRIKFSEYGVEIDGWYDIASDRINAPEKLLGWVYHLSQKTGNDQKFMQVFMEEVSKHYGYELYLCA